MTPLQILDNVKQRFVPLLHSEDKALNSLLKQALYTYQDLAGVIKRKQFDTEAGNSIPLPADFLARVGVTDSDLEFIDSTLFDNETLTLSLLGNESWPLTLTYLANLSESDFDTYQIPLTAVGLISDYLEVLISIPNTQRLRRISAAGKIDVSDLETHGELMDRKKTMEDTIRLSRAIISPFSFGG